MASDGTGLSSVPQKNQRHEGNHQTDTPTPEAGVPADPTGGEDTLKTTAVFQAVFSLTVSAEQDENGVPVCQFFLRGKCHFGHRCRFSHSAPSVDDSASVSPDHDEKEDGEKTEKYKKTVNKAAKQKFVNKEVNKKPRMRTADDVISRILWDPSVDGSDFVVGYVDRFLGVLERPFSDFNWDTDPCDCDYSTELALPRHRIQYFTYRGHRVWDRHSRTDRVFGSTGQSLAPPFGGEEEVKEINTEEQQQDRLETAEEQEPSESLHLQEERGAEESNHSVNTHLEEEEQSEMNTHTSDPIKEQKESGGACVTEEAKANAPSEEENLAEWQESWESADDSLSCLAGLKMSQNPSTPLEQREMCGGRPAKKKPTHFVTFRANTPAILSCFQQLQQELTALMPACAPHWNIAPRLHVTMCLLNLSGPAQVSAAGDILRRFAHLDRNPPVSLTFPVKLKHFNGKVLYLSPQPQLRLQQLNSGLQEAYRKEGWLHRDSYNPRYHLTLAKVEDREGDRIFEGVGDLKVGKGLNFGRLPVNTLHLCAMGGSVDGFYETVCTVTLR